MKNILLISFILRFTLSAFTQCAADYVGQYGVRHCINPDTITSYTFTASVSQINPSQILISNFHGIPNGVICSIEDTIVVDLQCAFDSLTLQPVFFPTCPTPSGFPGLNYSGTGHLYTDSIIINYHQINPNGQQDICLVYKLGLYTGVQEQINREKMITIYPNPTSHQLTVNTELAINEINIIDITGKTIKTIKQNTNLVNVADLSNGIYFIKLITDERTISKKFIKQ